jgi:type II secretory pathway component PulM
MLALGMAIVTVQFGRSLSFFYDAPRIYKAYLAGGVALIVVVIVLAISLPVFRRRAKAAPASGPARPRGAA